MTKNSQQPTVTRDDLHGDKYEHPAYALINISRVTGNTELFDSSSTHHHFISLSIKRAIKCSDGAHEFIMGKEELIEVWMSESQFARIITSMNMASGGACTLFHFNGKRVPTLDKEDRLNSHREMFKTKLQDVMNAQFAMSEKLEQWRKEKHRPTLKEMKALEGLTRRCSENFESNMAHYAQCFEDHMERVVDDAKTEIETHVLASTDRLGLVRDVQPALETDTSEGASDE